MTSSWRWLSAGTCGPSTSTSRTCRKALTWTKTRGTAKSPRKRDTATQCSSTGKPSARRSVRAYFFLTHCVFHSSPVLVGDFKPEDLALSHLYTRVGDIIQTVHCTARMYPHVRHVFIAGGYFSHPLNQRLAVRHWLRGEVNGKVLYGRVSESIQRDLVHVFFPSATAAYCAFRKRKPACIS